MTTSLATPTVPGQPDPNVPVDLTPAAAATRSNAIVAAKESKQFTGVLNVGPKEHPDHAVGYELLPSLTAYDMVVLQEAQDSGKFRELIAAIQRLVPQHQREALWTQMMDPDPALEQRMSLEDCMDVLADGMEQISARPTVK